MNGLKVTDLFSGAGGASAGLERAGYQIEACANHWPTAIATHSRNHPGAEHFTANLSETDFRAFPSTDVLWASPSCVWHARAGGRKKPPADVERLREDEGSIDRATAFAVIAATEVHGYEAIIVENVIEFTEWVLFDWWADGMAALGYRLQQQVIDAYDVGEAQRRKRWFGVFTRAGGVDLSAPDLPRRNALDILDADPGKPMTRRMYVSPQVDTIDDGRRHLVTYRRNAKARAAGDFPLATITAGGRHHAVAQIIDGVPHHRMLSLRELARGQGFPDSYEFEGKSDDVRKQIGNAVSVRVAEHLGRRVAASLGLAA